MTRGLRRLQRPPALAPIYLLLTWARHASLFHLLATSDQLAGSYWTVTAQPAGSRWLVDVDFSPYASAVLARVDDFVAQQLGDRRPHLFAQVVVQVPRPTIALVDILTGFGFTPLPARPTVN